MNLHWAFWWSKDACCVLLLKRPYKELPGRTLFHFISHFICFEDSMLQYIRCFSAPVCGRIAGLESWMFYKKKKIKSKYGFFFLVLFLIDAYYCCHSCPFKADGVKTNIYCSDYLPEHLVRPFTLVWSWTLGTTSGTFFVGDRMTQSLCWSDWWCFCPHLLPRPLVRFCFWSAVKCLLFPLKAQTPSWLPPSFLSELTQLSPGSLRAPSPILVLQAQGQAWEFQIASLIK